MKNYIFIYFSGGNAPSVPNEEVNKLWMGWFDLIKDSLVDAGNPFNEAGQVVTQAGNSQISESAASGYTIIKASSMDQAVQISQGCPILHVPGASVQVYEAQPM